MPKILWTTGFNHKYYRLVFSKVIDTWQLLPGDQIFYMDDPVPDLANDSRAKSSALDRTQCPAFLSSTEAKFWCKSRCIVQALRENAMDYDYLIWLDADVRVLKPLMDDDVLPRAHEVFSVNHKVIDNPPSHQQRLIDPYLVDLGIDTGFLAFNLRHSRLSELIELYDGFWNTEAMASMIRKYDTYALMHIVDAYDFCYRNLWHGAHTQGKRYCGFEDSSLEHLFYHHWGKRNKGALNDLA